MGNIHLFLIAGLFALALLMPHSSEGASLEELVMPGPVIAGHAKYEKECRRCHEPFSKTRQSILCVACHKETGQDIKVRQGFHGRIKNIATTDCKQCHTDHEGRNTDIVRLDKETFDHGATDFPLRGAHEKTPCRRCHAPKAKFRQAPAACFACHKTDDRHKGRLGKKCGDCHTAQSWRKAKFDHNKVTKFPLVGRHREATCSACHVNQRYEKTPRQCAACHRLDDVHGGRFGPKCESCHAPASWRKVTFDHDRKTKFPLRGAHKKASCHACHSAKLFGDKLRTACIDCHRADDEHKGRNGEKCQSCHAVTMWRKSKFSHDKNTRFPLKGSHAKLPCEACHKGSVAKEKLRTSCGACHQRDDVHKRRLGDQCERCHNAGGWSRKVFFEHDLTRFPLIGQHAVAPCEECHLTASYKGTRLECAKCHEKSDRHKRRLGPDCGLCHNPNGWAFWRFEHNKQTDYVLDGAHAKLHCEACHRHPVRNSISMNQSCNACHAVDDIHYGRFGQRCERCHTTTSFKKIQVNR